MIRQQFYVESYWKVVVYYDVDHNFFSSIERELKQEGFDSEVIIKIYDALSTGKAKAVTLSNTRKHLSYILFNRHSSKEDYLNSVVHEAEHVKQAMLEAYYVKDKGEPPAYTIGFIVQKMWEVFKSLIYSK